MAGGYLRDGTVSAALGEHAFAVPDERRRLVLLTAHDIPAAVLDSGGGMVSLDVTGQALRANLGDAERWAYELLVALAGSGPGNLGIEDQLGNRATWAQAVCTGGAARVHAFAFADVEMEFEAPAAAGSPAWQAVPALPGTYVGTDTLLDYRVRDAGGAEVVLGQHAEGMRIEMSRDYPLREVPRARGARSRGPARGAVVRFTVTSHAVASGAHLAALLDGLTRSIGARPLDLMANGNVYEDVVLESLSPRGTDFRATAFDVELVQQL